jgi:hypothetical protein
LTKIPSYPRHRHNPIIGVAGFGQNLLPGFLLQGQGAYNALNIFGILADDIFGICHLDNN